MDITKTREVPCSRCDEPRWTSMATPYICQRCREALAGSRCVADPLPSPAQRRAWAENGRSFAAKLAAGKAGRAELGRELAR